MPFDGEHPGRIHPRDDHPDDPRFGRPLLHLGLKRLARPLVLELERTVEDHEDQLNRIERTLADLAMGQGVPGGFDPELHLAPGVPRIRPLLVLLATQAAGGEGTDPSEVAFSAELLQMAIAVHDTALGRQDGRRRRIARRLLGTAAHWLGGHHLTLRAMEVARAAPTPEILNEVLDTVREIFEGHTLSEALRGRDASPQDYRDYAEAHTGAVFSFCTRAGGRLAGAPRVVVSALGRYGRHMGVAWHALEDQWVLSVPAEELPELMATRAASGRPVLPLIFAMDVDPEIDALLDRVLAQGDFADARELQERIIAAGGLYEARRLVAEETLAARRALRTLDPSPSVTRLDRLAASLGRSGAVDPAG